MIRSLAELVIFRIFASIIHISWLMTVIECTEERYALNLNPYQIFVFINEKTKPYLDLFKELQEKSKPYDIVLLPFDSSEAQEYVDDSIDPQLYNVISHSDIVARVMPKKFGDYRYMTETLLKRKNPDFDYMHSKWDQFMVSLKSKRSQSYVNTIRRFFQYGNQEFSDFIMDIFNGNLKELMDMSSHYTHMVCTNDLSVAQNFTKEFLLKLTDSQKEQLDTIIKDALDYNSLKESKAVFSDYIYSVFESDNDMPKASFAKREKTIKEPDFNIVITPSKKKKLADAEGDYEIQIVKDNGVSMPLDFGYRGDKMFYLLTLICQKTVGGLPTKFFTFDSSKLAIKQAYDEVFRTGGDVWVDTMAKDSHKISMCRSHAKEAIDNNTSLDINTAYWCNLDTTALYIGPKKKKLQVRRVRLPEERIIINDNNLLTRCLEGLPSFEQVVGYITPNSAKVMEVNLKIPSGRFGHDRDIDLEE